LNKLRTQGLSAVRALDLKSPGPGVSAYAGTYTADGEKVVHHVDTSWNGSWTGTDQVRFYKLDGDTLTITTAPLTAFSGEEVEVVLVWKKVH